MARFQKGQSGNPKGRPRKDRHAATGSAFDIILEKRLTVRQGSKQRELTVEEALEQRTYQDALKGGKAARTAVLKMILRRERAKAKQRPAQSPIDVKIERVDPENADAVLQVLGIAAPDKTWTESKPGDRQRLLLEPWAVKAALARRRTSVSQHDLLDLKRSTRDDGSIKWPRPEAS
ncbi:hypothetical protein B5C34_15780 [Pacificimonas flava]|uniref:DUF5681 domain-containing protein n=2 Tax=Pacificimonas TaxID=1960290 RepID=A0A219B0T3_9SPHN|nr:MULTISPECIES: DUF5681 domain-containing protein [Pacificimonas]MBZ6379574.1 hypothetical protein [Pacificimonas aurantium]OWV31952.1 hypothetical protein B5C34_15780 [Pacificimonas flava]